MNTIFAKPAEGRIVPLEDGADWPADGKDVPLNRYYRRRLADGDIVETRRPAKPKPEPAKKPEPAAKTGAEIKG